MSKDTARQEVEKVCFAYEKAGKTGNKKDWGKFYDLEDSLIKKVEFASHPKLSIPKKIADMLDEGDLMLLAWTHGNDLLGKVPDEERKAEIIRRNALARAYQACKALGVELVSIEA